jgi:spermidine synthase
MCPCVPLALLLTAVGGLYGATQAAPARDLFAPGASERVVFEGRSQWNRVLVIDEGEQRSLRFDDADGDNQSTVSLRDPRAVPMEYIRHAASALAFTRLRRRSLVVGLGGGTYPMLLRRSFPAMTIDVVELDPLVRRVARQYFGFVEDAKLKVRIADGARFMRRTPKRWDVIFLDAYGAAGIPAALGTDAFFADVARSLAKGGIAVANIADSDAVREKDLIAHFAKAFPSCILLHTPRSDNIIAVAGASLPADVEAALRVLDGEGRLPFPTADMAPRYHRCQDD